MKFPSSHRTQPCIRFCPGFTLLEVIIVIGILGILLALSYPSILNSMHTRALEGAARTITTNLQWAKYQAVKTKMMHRLRFAQQDGVWTSFLEREVQPDVWQDMPGYVKRSISTSFNITVSLPTEGVVYNSLGLVENYTADQNTIILQSDKLKNQEQPDVRQIQVFAGGTVQYLRTSS